MCNSLHGQQVDADVQAWHAAAVRRVALTNGRVHGGEVDRVSQGSAVLAWWSADAESDSQPEGGRRGEGSGSHRGAWEEVGGLKGVGRE